MLPAATTMPLISTTFSLELPLVLPAQTYKCVGLIVHCVIVSFLFHHPRAMDLLVLNFPQTIRSRREVVDINVCNSTYIFCVFNNLQQVFKGMSSCELITETLDLACRTFNQFCLKTFKCGTCARCDVMWTYTTICLYVFFYFSGVFKI